MSLDEDLKTNIKKRPKKSLFLKIPINYLKQRTQRHNILKIMCYNNSVKDCKNIYNFPYYTPFLFKSILYSSDMLF